MNSRNKFVLVLSLLLITALACSSLPSLGGGNDNGGNSGEAGPSGNEATSSNDSGEDPAENPAAPAPVGGQPGPNEIDLDDETLYTEITGSNYSVVMDFNFTGVLPDGTTLFRQILLEGQRSYDPQRSYFKMTPNDPAVMDGISYMEIADIEGTDHIYYPEGGCFIFGNDEFNNPFDTLLDSGGVLMGTAQLEQSNVEVNGVLTDQYRITEENIDPADPSSQDYIEITEGSVFVAQGDGVVVRMVLKGRGYSELLTGDPSFEGDIMYQLDFTPTSSAMDIQPPENCRQENAGSEFPILPDAQNLSVLGELTSYSTQTPFADAVNFYKTEMAALGYSIIQEIAADPTAIIGFTNGSIEVNLLIGPNTEGGGLQVIIGATP